MKKSSITSSNAAASASIKASVKQATYHIDGTPHSNVPILESVRDIDAQNPSGIVESEYPSSSSTLLLLSPSQNGRRRIPSEVRAGTVIHYDARPGSEAERRKNKENAAKTEGERAYDKMIEKLQRRSAAALKTEETEKGKENASSSSAAFGNGNAMSKNGEEEDYNHYHNYSHIPSVRPSLHDPAPEQLRVIQWNIERGQELAGIIETLRALDADVLILQELDVNCRRSNYVDVPYAIANELQLDGYFIVEFEEFDSVDRPMEHAVGPLSGQTELALLESSSSKANSTKNNNNNSDKEKMKRVQNGDLDLDALTLMYNDRYACGDGPEGRHLHGNAIFSKYTLHDPYVIGHAFNLDWEKEGIRLHEPRNGGRATLRCTLRGGYESREEVEGEEEKLPKEQLLQLPLLPPLHIYCAHLEVFCGILGRVSELADIMGDANELTRRYMNAQDKMVAESKRSSNNHSSKKKTSTYPKHSTLFFKSNIDTSSIGAGSGGMCDNDGDGDEEEKFNLYAGPLQDVKVQQVKRIPHKEDSPELQRTQPAFLLGGDLNTMAHSIVRFSSRFATDRMRFMSLGETEALWLQRNVLSRNMWQQHSLACCPLSYRFPGFAVSSIWRLLFDHAWIWNTIYGVSQEELTRLDNTQLCMYDTSDKHQSITLSNPHYKDFVRGKFDWLLLSNVTPAETDIKYDQIDDHASGAVEKNKNNKEEVYCAGGLLPWNFFSGNRNGVTEGETSALLSCDSTDASSCCGSDSVDLQSESPPSVRPSMQPTIMMKMMLTDNKDIMDEEEDEDDDGNVSRPFLSTPRKKEKEILNGVMMGEDSQPGNEQDNNSSVVPLALAGIRVLSVTGPAIEEDMHSFTFKHQRRLQRQEQEQEEPREGSSKIEVDPLPLETNKNNSNTGPMERMDAIPLQPTANPASHANNNNKDKNKKNNIKKGASSKSRGGSGARELNSALCEGVHPALMEAVLDSNGERTSLYDYNETDNGDGDGAYTARTATSNSQWNGVHNSSVVKSRRRTLESMAESSNIKRGVKSGVSPREKEAESATSERHRARLSIGSNYYHYQLPSYSSYSRRSVAGESSIAAPSIAASAATTSRRTLNRAEFIESLQPHNGSGKIKISHVPGAAGLVLPGGIRRSFESTVSVDDAPHGASKATHVLLSSTAAIAAAGHPRRPTPTEKENERKLHLLRVADANAANALGNAGKKRKGMDGVKASSSTFSARDSPASCYEMEPSEMALHFNQNGGNSTRSNINNNNGGVGHGDGKKGGAPSSVAVVGLSTPRGQNTKGSASNTPVGLKSGSSPAKPPHVNVSPNQLQQSYHRGPQLTTERLARQQRRLKADAVATFLSSAPKTRSTATSTVNGGGGGTRSQVDQQSRRHRRPSKTQSSVSRSSAQRLGGGETEIKKKRSSKTKMNERENDSLRHRVTGSLHTQVASPFGIISCPKLPHAFSNLPREYLKDGLNSKPAATTTISTILTTTSSKAKDTLNDMVLSVQRSFSAVLLSKRVQTCLDASNKAIFSSIGFLESLKSSQLVVQGVEYMHMAVSSGTSALQTSGLLEKMNGYLETIKGGAKDEKTALLPAVELTSTTKEGEGADDLAIMAVTGSARCDSTSISTTATSSVPAKPGTMNMCSNPTSTATAAISTTTTTTTIHTGSINGSTLGITCEDSSMTATESKNSGKETAAAVAVVVKVEDNLLNATSSSSSNLSCPVSTNNHHHDHLPGYVLFNCAYEFSDHRGLLMTVRRRRGIAADVYPSGGARYTNSIQALTILIAVKGLPLAIFGLMLRRLLTGNTTTTTGVNLSGTSITPL